MPNQKNNLQNGSRISYKTFQEASSEDIILYFAYGSNINSVTHKWRNLDFDEKFPCILKDYKLTFDLRGFAFVEGGFGNIRPFNGECIHGLSIPMTKKDFLTNIKGKESPQYEIHEVQVEKYGEDSLLNAVTLTVKNTDGKYLYPSRRYLDLIIHGAEENNFDKEYIQYLKNFPDVKSALTLFGHIFRIIFILFYFFPGMLYFLFRFFKVSFDGNKKLQQFMELLMWPNKTIPALFFKYLPRKWIIKNEVGDPNGNCFKYKKD